MAANPFIELVVMSVLPGDGAQVLAESKLTVLTVLTVNILIISPLVWKAQVVWKNRLL